MQLSMRISTWLSQPNLMQAELQVLSPFVPIRKVTFLRFCKQLAESAWAVVDVSIDGLQMDQCLQVACCKICLMDARQSGAFVSTVHSPNSKAEGSNPTLLRSSQSTLLALGVWTTTARCSQAAAAPTPPPCRRRRRCTSRAARTSTTCTSPATAPSPPPRSSRSLCSRSSTPRARRARWCTCPRHPRRCSTSPGAWPTRTSPPTGRRARRTRRPSSAAPSTLRSRACASTSSWPATDPTGGVRFCSPEDREAAMEKQPFALDGASVRLVREGETSNCFTVQLTCLAHVALLRYPKEQRNLEDIESNCRGFGHLMEVDPACYDAPDLSPVRVVVNMEHPREIPREVRIRYTDFRFCSVVPVKILKIWDRSESTGADGKYVPMYSTAAAAGP